MDQSFVERLESVTQELHTAKQQISILNANVAHLSDENADLQLELSTLKDNEKDDKIRLKSVSDVCQLSEDKVTDLNERLQHALEEKETAERRAEDLAIQVASLEGKQTDDAGRQSALCVCGAEMAVLEEKLAQLEVDKDQKKRQLSDAVSDLHKALEKSSTLKAELEEMQEEVEGLQCQISSQSNIIQCQREELDGMRSQAEVSSASMLDSNRKGNSLFSEVEDRRVIAETQMVKVLSKAEKLEKRLKREQKENQRLKNQISLLMRTANGNASEKTVQSLEREVEEGKKQVLKLTQQMTQLSQQNKQLSASSKPPQPTTPQSAEQTPLVNFLKSTIAQLQKESEEHRKASDGFQVQCIQLDFLWTQKKNESRSLKRENDRLSSMNAHLTSVIEGLKESDSNENVEQPKEMVKISLTGDQQDQQESLKFDPVVDDGCTTLKREMSEIDGSAGIDNDKENNSSGQDLKSFLLGTKSKSVAFSTDTSNEDNVSILSDVGNQQGNNGNRKQEVGDINEGMGAPGKAGKGKKAGGGVRSGNGQGKYRSVTYVNMEDTNQEEQAPECKQQ